MESQKPPAIGMSACGPCGWLRRGKKLTEVEKSSDEAHSPSPGIRRPGKESSSTPSNHARANNQSSSTTTSSRSAGEESSGRRPDSLPRSDRSLSRSASYNNRSRHFNLEGTEVRDPEEERRMQQERKRKLRESIRQVVKDKSVPQSPSARLKLTVASAYVRRRTSEGRFGPAEGSVLDRDPEMIELRRRLQAAAAAGPEQALQDMEQLLDAELDDDADGYADHGEGSDVVSPEHDPLAPPVLTPFHSATSLVDVHLSDEGSASSIAKSLEGAVDAAATPSSQSPAPPVVAVGKPSSSPTAVPESSPAPLQTPTATLGKEASSGAGAAAEVGESPSSPSLLSPSRSVSSSPRRALKAAQLKLALAFVGEWKSVELFNLEAYLKFLGVGWAKRKVALAFRPQPVFAVVDGVLQVLLATPIGERLERLPINEDVIDTDPSGVEFVKRSHWEGSALITLAEDFPYASGKRADVVTTRTIDADGRMVQKCVLGDNLAEFTRIYERK